MSGKTEGVERLKARFEGESVARILRDFYHVPALAAVMLFMLWVRMQSYDAFTRGKQVLLSGNDAYYHLREVGYTVRHWPTTMPFDPWTRFPYGTTAGQFGTLYDQLMATAALLVGLGSPTDRQIALVVLVTPAVVGALVALPVYFIGERLHGRVAGLFSVVVLAFLPGGFLVRSTVGFADHQVAEVFFQALALLGVLVAVEVVERELPVYEQILDRDLDGLRRPLLWSALGGVTVFLYMWVWPPGVVFVGILGVFFVVMLSADYVRGRSPEHVAIAGVGTTVVAGLLWIPRIGTLSFTPTSPSPVHTLLAFGVAIGCVFMAGLARYWDGLDVDRRFYPVAVLGLVVVGFGLLAVVLPGLFSTVQTNLNRAFLFGASQQTLTISEAQPTPGVTGQNVLGWNFGVIASALYQRFGLAAFTAALLIPVLSLSAFTDENRVAGRALVAVWSVMTLLMMLTQVRFGYYFALVVAVLNGWAFGRVVDVVDLPSITDRLGDVQGYQVMAVLTAVLLILGPLVPPFAVSSQQEFQQAQQSNSPTPQFVVFAGQSGPSGALWNESGTWMQDNTPEPGTYYGSGGEAMELYGTYEESDDFEYPEGAYGVMSWWDYGHWITVLGERIPHANPFQQNPRTASAFFQAQSEERAELILEAIPNLRDRQERVYPPAGEPMSNETLRRYAENATAQQRGEDVRYVMIDDQTAAEKYRAITSWAGPGWSAYSRSARYQVRGQNVTVDTLTGEYRETMLYKLYYLDANGLEHYRLVREEESYALVGGLTNGQNSAPQTSRTIYRQWSQEAENTSRLLTRGRVFGQATQVGQGGLYAYDAHIESELKTFERVPGATVTGRLTDGNVSDRTVTVRVPLETHTGRQFSYSQRVITDEDGRFEVTVPYSTDEAVGTNNGGTDAAVTATGPYSVRVGLGFSTTEAGTFEVTETAVYEGDTVDAGDIALPESESESGSGSGSMSNAGDGDDNASVTRTDVPSATAPVSPFSGAVRP